LEHLVMAGTILATLEGAPVTVAAAVATAFAQMMGALLLGKATTDAC
jgi:hypothetical protein